MLPGVRADLFDFGRRYVTRINSAYTSTIPMNLEHDLSGLFAAEGKKFLQHYDDKIHGRVIVIQKQNLEHRRRLDLGLFRLQNRAFAMPYRHSEHHHSCDCNQLLF